MKNLANASRGADGFTLIELLMVLVVILVLSGVSLFYLSSHQTLYKPDDQSLLITDVLLEARQRSLTQRETMRVEINLTRMSATLIDENRPATIDDDVVLKSINLFEPVEVVVGTQPSNISVLPPEFIPAPNAIFVPSNYTSSIGDNVCTLRFLANGSVSNGGNTAIGTGAVTTSSTLHIWAPNRGNSSDADIARAITVIGATGIVRLWEYDFSSSNANKWRDSRRAATYGGATGGNTNGNANGP